MLRLTFSTVFFVIIWNSLPMLADNWTSTPPCSSNLCALHLKSITAQCFFRKLAHKRQKFVKQATESSASIGYVSSNSFSDLKRSHSLLLWVPDFTTRGSQHHLLCSHISLIILHSDPLACHIVDLLQVQINSGNKIYFTIDDPTWQLILHSKINMISLAATMVKPI